jgi:iron complex transport system substrate-binding protein
MWNLVVVGFMMIASMGTGMGTLSANQNVRSVSPTDVITGYVDGTVETERGPIEVPANPARVVTLSEYALDTAVSLGVLPVGAVASTGMDGVAPYIAESVPGIKIVGAKGEVDVDAVSALKPDLILASWQTDDALYASLSEIAPTIVPPSIEEGEFSDLRGWEYDVLVYGHALGKAEETALALQELHERTDAVRDGAGQSLAGESAVVIQWTEVGPMILGPGHFSSVQLQRVGFLPVSNGQAEPLSIEELSRIDAEWLFIAPVGEEGEKAYEIAREETLERDIPAVRKGQVVMVDGSLWTSTAGPIAANLVLDDIEKSLGD